MNIQERLTAFAMLGAGWVMWLLVLLSIISLAIILERAYILATHRDDLEELRRDVLALLREGDVQGAFARLDLAKSFEVQVATAGLSAVKDGAAAAEDRMRGAAQLAKLQMERYLVFLGTVGNNAPFLGLLGTVIGIIRAFAALDASQGQVSEGLMTQIGEALVATAIGILVALPAVAFFNFYQRVIKARVIRADSMGRELLAWSRAQRELDPGDPGEPEQRGPEEGEEPGGGEEPEEPEKGEEDE